MCDRLNYAPQTQKSSPLTFDLRYSTLLKNIGRKWTITLFKAQTEVKNYDKTLLANFRLKYSYIRECRYSD
jgi:hypothetical protein